MTNYDKQQRYTQIEKLVIDRLKTEAKEIASLPVQNRIGDAHFSKTELKNTIIYRKKQKRGFTKLLEAFKLLGL